MLFSLFQLRSHPNQQLKNSGKVTSPAVIYRKTEREMSSVGRVQVSNK